MRCNTYYVPMVRYYWYFTITPPQSGEKKIVVNDVAVTMSGHHNEMTNSFFLLLLKMQSTIRPRDNNEKDLRYVDEILLRIRAGSVSLS